LRALRSALSICLELHQQLRRLLRRLLRIDRLLDLAVGADHIGDALGVPILRRLAGTVGEPDPVVDVAEQPEGVLELLGERAVLLRRVEGDAQDLDALLFEFADSITEPAALLGSPGRVGLGIEPEHDSLAGEILQAHGLAVVVETFERGCLGADFEHGGRFQELEETEEVSKHEWTLRQTRAGDGREVAGGGACSRA
jgi:hypothetical protein